MAKSKWMYFSAIGVAIYYLIVVWYTGFFSEPGDLFFRFPDAQEYRDVSEWLLGTGAKAHLILERTYLYPVLLGLSLPVIGVWGVWILQASIWALCFYFFGKTLQGLGLSRNGRFFWCGLFLLNLTPIYMTTVAMTESLAMLGFSCFAYLAVCRPSKNGTDISVRQFRFLVMVGGLMAALKPNFFVVFYLMWLFSLVIGYRRKLLRWLWPWLVVGVVPLLVQYVIIFTTFGRLEASTKSNHVLKVSLYAQVYDKVTGEGLVETHNRLMNEKVATSKIIDYLKAHPFYTLGAYAKNLEENIRTVVEVREDSSSTLHFWRRQLNAIYYWMHILMFIPIFFALFRFRDFKNDRDVTIWVLSLVFMGALLPTGVTMWSGDRWTAPLFGVWVPLYLLVGQELGLLPLHRRQKLTNT